MIELKSNMSEKVAYNIPEMPAYIRSALLSMYPNYSAVSHWHDDVELIHVLSGHMQYNVNGDIVTLQTGEGIFVNAKQIYYGFSEDYSECKFICILLHPMLLCTSQYVERNFVAPVLANEAFSYLLLDETIEWEKKILEILDELYMGLQETAWELQVMEKFYGIWRELYGHMPKEEGGPTKGSHQLSALKDMLGYIQKNYQKKINLGDIAAAGGVCKSSCCSIFQNYLSQTPIAYLTDYRLKKSVDLMRETDMLITEIGYEVGFSGASYFTETFHKQFGCSPTAYRTGRR